MTFNRMNTRLLLFFFSLLNLSILSGQPDSRFRPFDWVLYRGSGSINSISEGYSHAYIGTQSGGVMRYNLYGNDFVEPITTAQGLEENEVTAVHFDHKTGILWATTLKHIQYSYSKEGDWFSIPLKQLGMFRNDKIQRIGSSERFIWLQAQSTYLKLDHSSGTLVGIFPYPDELDLEWSSGPHRSGKDHHEIFMNYSVMGGWILTGDHFIDPLGRNVGITTAFVGNHGNVWAGGEDGTVFHASTTMESFYPLVPGPQNLDVNELYFDGEILWIGSYNYRSSKGISWVNPHTGESDYYEFASSVNMKPMPVYSIHVSGTELWAGGEDEMLIYDMEKDYWRTISEEQGVPQGKIWDMVGDSIFIWTASSSGLNRIERSTRRESTIGIEHLFSHNQVYDVEEIENEIWIGSRSGLYVFSKDNPQIKRAVDLGRKDFPELMIRITSIKEFDGDIFVAGEMGIAKFDIADREWKLIFPSVVYHAKTVYSMVVNQKYIFLGVEDGLYRINKKTGFVKEYTFPFIGQVNGIVLDGKSLWLGSTNGLIKFKWKRDS